MESKKLELLFNAIRFDWEEIYTTILNNSILIHLN